MNPREQPIVKLVNANDPEACEIEGSGVTVRPQPSYFLPQPAVLVQQQQSQPRRQQQQPDWDEAQRVDGHSDRCTIKYSGRDAHDACNYAIQTSRRAMESDPIANDGPMSNVAMLMT